MSEPSFPVTLRADLAVVTTPDEVDIGNAALFREAVKSAAAARSVVVIDMSGTEFCDSSGLNVLVRALREAGATGGELRLVVGGSPLQRILTVTGVGGLFALYQSLDEALQPV